MGTLSVWPATRKRRSPMVASTWATWVSAVLPAGFRSVAPESNSTSLGNTISMRPLRMVTFSCPASIIDRSLSISVRNTWRPRLGRRLLLAQLFQPGLGVLQARRQLPPLAGQLIHVLPQLGQAVLQLADDRRRVVVFLPAVGQLPLVRPARLSAAALARQRLVESATLASYFPVVTQPSPPAGRPPPSEGATPRRRRTRHRYVSRDPHRRPHRCSVHVFRSPKQAPALSALPQPQRRGRTTRGTSGAGADDRGQRARPGRGPGGRRAHLPVEHPVDLHLVARADHQLGHHRFDDRSVGVLAHHPPQRRRDHVHHPARGHVDQRLGRAAGRRPAPRRPPGPAAGQVHQEVDAPDLGPGSRPAPPAPARHRTVPDPPAAPPRAGGTGAPAYAASTEAQRPPALTKLGPGRTRPRTRTTSPRRRPASDRRQGWRSIVRRISASAMGRRPAAPPGSPRRPAPVGHPAAIDSRSSSTSGDSAQEQRPPPVRRAATRSSGRYPSTRRNSHPSRTGNSGPPCCAASGWPRRRLPSPGLAPSGTLSLVQPDVGDEPRSHDGILAPVWAAATYEPHPRHVIVAPTRAAASACLVTNPQTMVSLQR